VQPVATGRRISAGISGDPGATDESPLSNTARANAYKALPEATYGGGEEAGGLVLRSPKHAGSLLPGPVQASRPSREGPIIAVIVRGDFPPYPPAARPMANTAIAAGVQLRGHDLASQRRKR
jgi:hypothetical protein